MAHKQLLLRHLIYDACSNKHINNSTKSWNTYYKPILRLGIPIAVGQLGVIIMGFADTMMVGRYSTDALAAASFVNAIFNLITYMLMGYSYGLTPLISSLVGRGKKVEAGATLKYGLVCNFLYALCSQECLWWHI